MNNVTKEHLYCARQDLKIVRRSNSAGVDWIVSDPLKLEYFIFDWLEIEILSRIKRPKTLSQLWQELRDVVPHSLTIEEVASFISRLVSDNLVQLNESGQGDRLYNQEIMAARELKKGTLTSVLSIKLPGFNPESTLEFLNPIGSVFFSKSFISLVAFAAAATVVFSLIFIGSVIEKLPTIGTLLDPFHVFLMLAAFGMVKVLHELGHGLACQKFGGKSSEMGMLFLVFVPCLYCDVTDMWLQPSRFKRVMVSLAGVYVEMVIATLCFWGWFFSAPGVINSMLFSMLLITSINTLFVNGNPLLKYDGYFVLSDLLDAPNLASNSQQQLRSFVYRIFFNNDDSIENSISFWPLFYAVSAIAYRAFIFSAILFMVYTFFDKLDLTWPGSIFVFFLACVMAIPVSSSAKKIITSTTRPRKKLFSWLILLSLLFALVYTAFFFEFSNRIYGRAEVFVMKPELVYASNDGRLFPDVKAGDKVKKDDVIFKIENFELSEELVAKNGALKEALQAMDGLKIEQGFGNANEAEVEILSTRIKILKERILEVDSEILALEISAKTDGTVIVSNEKSAEQAKPDFLATKNLGCRVSRGDLICLIGDPTHLVGFVSVDEFEIDLVQAGQEIKIYIPFAKKAISGRVNKISLQRVANDSTENENLLNSSYIVEFNFEDESFLNHGGYLGHGSNTKVVIVGSKTTPAAFMYRHIRGAFFF